MGITTYVAATVTIIRDRLPLLPNPVPAGVLDVLLHLDEALKVLVKLFY